MPRTFTLLRTLGRGAHGTVHLASLRDDDDWQQTVAVKQLLPEWSADPDLVARLKDEARLLALLQHDHVVRVHGLTRIDGNLAILMEPIEGTDLGRLAATAGALPPRVAVELVEAVADALDAAWETIPPGQTQPLRVVHRDIKPSNVMVTVRGGVKVMDFGVARASFEAREGETRSQQFGTARYMAPERWLRGEADHRSDVFSLGITLCELASGRAVSRPRLVPELFDEDLARAVAELPGGVAALVRDMTRFDPAARPTGREVVRRCRALLPDLPPGPGLREWAATRVVAAAPEPVDATAPATVVRENPLPTTADPRSARSRRSAPSPWTWAVVVVLALAVAAGVRALRSPGSAPSPEAPARPVVVTARLPEAEPVDDPPPTAVVVPAPPAPPLALRPAPAPAPRPAPAPPAPAPTVPVRFVLAPGLSVSTEFGSLERSPGVLQLPSHRTVNVTVTEGGQTWTCTIHVSGSAVEVRVRPFAEGRCSQS